MASFVIHYLAGERLLKNIEDKYSIEIDNSHKINFLLGNLIVDSYKEKKDKFITHFRSEEDKNLIIKVPKVDKFIDKYKSLITKNYSALGYLFHLYTDKMFFSDLFEKSFINMDENDKKTIYQDKLKNIKIIKTGQIVTKEELFSSDSENSIYNDYTKMNRLLLDYYGNSFDSNYLSNGYNNFINPGIEEINYSCIKDIIDKTNQYIKDSYELTDIDLKVFDTDVIKMFIDEVVDGFINSYNDVIEELINMIVVASNNKGKIKEIKEILNDKNIVSLKELDVDIEVTEDGETFYDNALKKAKEIYNVVHVPVIADDSGICIKQLNDWPGVYTHRAIEGIDNDVDRNKEIVKRCQNIDDKSVEFICNIVYFDGKDVISSEGRLEGKITNPRGENGFGFDPIFELDNGSTLSEISDSLKNELSPRKKALQEIKQKLEER